MGVLAPGRRSERAGHSTRRRNVDAPTNAGRPRRQPTRTRQAPDRRPPSNRGRIPPPPPPGPAAGGGRRARATCSAPPIDRLPDGAAPTETTNTRGTGRSIPITTGRCREPAGGLSGARSVCSTGDQVAVLAPRAAQPVACVHRTMIRSTTLRDAAQARHWETN